MVDVRLYEVQAAPAEDVWLYTTTPAFAAPLSVFMHSSSEIEGEGTNDVVLWSTDEWIPCDVPDLALWLRGDMYAGSFGEYVWTDQSASNANGTGSLFAIPTSAVFGKPSFTLPAGESFTLPPLATDGGPCTIVAVYRASDSAVESQIVAWYGAGSTANVANVGSNFLVESSFSLGATASVTSATVGHSYGLDNVSHREVIVRSGLVASTDESGYACKVDSNAREVIANTNNAMTFVGGVGPFDGIQDAGVAEVVVYNRALDGVDLANLHAYLDARYVWEPTDISYDVSCVLWLRGDYGQSATGWLDRSGNGNHATQLAGAPYEPSVGTTLINGKPTARFDLNAFYDLPALYLASGSWTVFVVYKLDAALGVGAFGVLAYWEDSNNATSNVMFLAEASTGYGPLCLCGGYNTTTNGVAFGTSAIYDDFAHTVSATYTVGDPTDPVSYTTRDNWIAQSGVGDGPSVTITGRIGGDGLGNGIIGEIAEIIIYDGVLSARDQLSVTEYLSARYDTLSATGTGSGTISPLVADGSGTASAGAGVTGTGSGTISPLVAAGSGGETFTGTGTGTLSSLVAASSGTETFTGTGSGTLSPLVASGAGTETFTGTGFGALQPLDTSGAGAESFTGTGSGTLSPLVASGSGTETMTGTGSGTLSPLVADGTGSETFTGTGSGTISPLDASGSGAESMTGTGSGTLSPLVADGSGSEVMTGTGSAALSPLVASATGEETITGTGSAAISPLVCAASGTEILTGSGACDISPLAADGAGSAAGVGVTGTGSCALSPLVADGAAVETISGSGSGALAPLEAAGAGALSVVGTGSAALGPLVASGVGLAYVPVTGTGGAVLSSLDASGAGLLVITGTGSASISALVALGFYVAPLAGSPRTVLGRSQARAALADDHAATTLATSTAKARLA